MNNKLFVLILSLLFCSSIIEAAIVNGSCGNNLTWSLNTNDRILKIEGYGKMDNWSSSNIPWHEYRSYIDSISLPSGLESIGNNAFYECYNLSHITIPNSVQKIGYCAFLSCSNIISVSIPNSVTSIGFGAFSGCNSMKIIKIPEGITDIGDHMFESCTSLSSITIPENVVNIGNYAFQYCTNLRHIELNEKLMSIGSYAFYNCSSLSFIKIPDAVRNIYYRTFASCNLLDSVVLGENLETIAVEAFKQCNKLRRITSYAPFPPTGGTDSGIINYLSTLYVPSNYLDAYENSIWWEDFFSIKALPDDATHITNIYENNTSRKIINNGHVYIKNADKTFTVTGQEVK